MDVNALKHAVNEHRKGCAEKKGSMVVMSDTGPAGMAVIDALVSAIETLDKRLAAVERRPKV
jgi:hypothetical protein